MGAQHMIDQDLKDLWTPTGLLLGFQVTLFKWRIEREAGIGDVRRAPWLAPADYVGIGGMLCFLFGVILLPSAGIIAFPTARVAFGLGSLFFIGQYLSLAGHYQLYNKDIKKMREHVWFHFQEKVLISLTLLVALFYLLVEYYPALRAAFSI
jgi:hypothetical protein